MDFMTQNFSAARINGIDISGKPIGLQILDYHPAGPAFRLGRADNGDGVGVEETVQPVHLISRRHYRRHHYSIFASFALETQACQTVRDPWVVTLKALRCVVGFARRKVPSPKRAETSQSAMARFSAAIFPSRPETRSNVTFWPSSRPGSPDRSTALICTKASLEPSSGSMNPKPLVGLNHFTVPFVAMPVSSQIELGPAPPAAPLRKR